MSSQELSSLTVVAATWEQTVASRKRTHVQWSRGLSVEEYLTREHQLDTAEHATGNKFQTWVLVPRDDTTTLDFKCSCETFRRNAFVKRPGSSQAEDVTGYGVASVFTPKENRRKGYARFMVRLLHHILAPPTSLPTFPESWGAPPASVPGFGNAAFSVLYSDIGPEFYRKAGPDDTSEGWVAREAYSTIWRVDQFHVPSEEPRSTQWLSQTECNSLWVKDAAKIKNGLDGIRSEKTVFTFRPDGGAAAYLMKRTSFFSPNQPYTLPDCWGVVIRESHQAKLPETDCTFATWAIDIPPTLIITRLRATSHTFPYLVKSFVEKAKECGVKQVEVWNLPKELEAQAAEMGGETILRDEHLNSFKWYGPEKNEDLEWAYNEKFCWC